jgi:hypothetical protein
MDGPTGQLNQMEYPALADCLSNCFMNSKEAANNQAGRTSVKNNENVLFRHTRFAMKKDMASLLDEAGIGL